MSVKTTQQEYLKVFFVYSMPLTPLKEFWLHCAVNIRFFSYVKDFRLRRFSVLYFKPEVLEWLIELSIEAGRREYND